MRYKLKKFDVDAEQFLPEIDKPLPRGVVDWGDNCWSIKTLKNWLHWPSYGQDQPLIPGDWIVRTNRGEVYRMSNYDFKRTYRCP